MTTNVAPQFIKPVDDGSPSTTVTKVNVNDVIATLHPGYVAGRWYSLLDCVTANTAIAAVDTLYFFHFQIFQPVTITSALMRVTTGGAASSVKSGIWANSPGSTRPLGVPLISDNTGVATTGSGVNVSLALAGTLSPGLYWMGTKFTGTLPTVQCVSSAFLMRIAGIPTTNATFPSLGTGFSFADAYANNIAATSIAEGATFTPTTSAIVPNVAIVT